MREEAIPSRRLDDKVLQSAHDAVLTQPLGPADPDSGFDTNAGVARNRRRNHVANHPLASALIAAGAGALAIVALQSIMRSRHRTNKAAVRP